MTLPTDADAENEKSTALSPVVRGREDLELFLAKSSDSGEPSSKRSFGARLLDYSAHAAMIVGLIGFAWTLSDHVVRRPAPAQVASVAASVSKQAAASDLVDLRRSNERLSADVHALQTRVAQLQTALSADKTPAQLHVLQGELADVKTGLASAKTETVGALAQLSGKIDKLGHDPNSKMQQLVDRLGRLETSTVDVTPTGSLPQGAAAAAKGADAPVPPVRPMDAKVASLDPARDATHPAAQKSAEETSKGAKDIARPQVLANWVVRDVYDGVALIEGRYGALEVVPGVGIPGAGTVKSIDRRGNGWTVTTTKGVLAYAAPSRIAHRATMHDIYRGDRYDAF